MATLDMLNVAIGIIFIYLLLSLIATAINEVIENILKNRAANLQRGIQELIDPSNKKNENSLVKKLYEHPLICGLYKGDYKKGKGLPSYIPSRSFALVMMDLIVSAGKNKAEEGVQNTDDLHSAPITAAALKNALQSWPHPHSRKAVLTLVNDAEGDINKVKLNLENWFNGSMDRVSGWYKRQIQVILIVIGVALASVMNADSIALFKSLVKDAPLRNSLVASAQEFAKSNDSAPGDSTAETRVKNNIKRINDLRLPIGWDWQESSSRDKNISNYSLAIPSGEGFQLFGSWLAKIVGLLITGFAVSLGAPFWFDTLNKVMVIRSTVKPTEKSKDEGSEDRQKTEKADTKE